MAKEQIIILCDLKAVDSNIRGREYTECYKGAEREEKRRRKCSQRVERRQIKSVDISPVYTETR